MKRKDLKRIFKLVSHEIAQLELLKAASIKPLDPEEIPIEESLGRILAVNVVANVNIPAENRAVFDGYAVNSTDTQSASSVTPAVLKIVGETFPGDTPSSISSHQAMFVACGAPLPKGANAVVKTENVRLLEDKIELYSPVNPDENVGLVGEDIEKGRLLLKSGHYLRPQDIGLLAALGMKFVKVFQKPKVGIISVGDELVKLSKKEPDKIANNYALIVSALVSEFGATPQLFGIVPDNLDEIKRAISEAVEKTDIVATIAGCSVGPKDLVPDAINALGELGIVFHGVKLSPGKVMGAGIVKGKPIVMLPGHIVSTYAGFYLILVHLIAQYSGLGEKFPFSVVKARIAQDVKAKPLANFLRVRLVGGNGEFEAEPVKGGSSVLASLVKSNGYTIVPKGKGLTKGTVVKVVLYDRYEFTRLTHP
jgi:molybdenum cofactor synthesis domain-containing protein